MSTDTDYLQYALDHDVVPLRGRYEVVRTLTLAVIAARAGCMLDWPGVVLVSTIIDGSPVLEISATVDFRGLVISGLRVAGNGKEGHGIYIHAAAGGWIEKWLLSAVAVESVGGDGLHFTGNVFQGQLIACSAQNCLGHGTVFENGLGGIVSAIMLVGGSYDQNGLNGLATLPYPTAPYDITAYGIYARNNQQAGASFLNGCRLLSACGFENNWESAAVFAHGDAGAILLGGGRMTCCNAATNSKQTYLVRAFLNAGSTLFLDNPAAQSESVPAALTPIRRYTVSGAGNLVVDGQLLALPAVG